MFYLNEKRGTVSKQSRKKEVQDRLVEKFAKNDAGKSDAKLIFPVPFANGILRATVQPHRFTHNDRTSRKVTFNWKRSPYRVGGKKTKVAN